MSFDVFLELFGGRAPGAARDAVAVVLRDLAARGPDEFGQYEVPIADLQMTRSGTFTAPRCTSAGPG